MIKCKPLWFITFLFFRANQVISPSTLQFLFQGKSKVKEYLCKVKKKKRLCVTFKSFSNIRTHNDILTDQLSKNKLKYWIIFSSLKLTLIMEGQGKCYNGFKKFLCYVLGNKTSLYLISPLPLDTVYRTLRNYGHSIFQH